MWPDRAVPGLAVPGLAVPGLAGPGRAWQGRAVPDRAGPGRYGTERARTSQDGWAHHRGQHICLASPEWSGGMDSESLMQHAQATGHSLSGRVSYFVHRHAGESMTYPNRMADESHKLAVPFKLTVC